jgi:hypothetical protein
MPTPAPDPSAHIKRIGGTTYIVTARFNGDKRISLIQQIIRLITHNI